MKRGMGLSDGVRRAGFLLAVLALVLKVAVPAGFMLTPIGHNQIAVTLCSGHGQQQAVLDLTTGQILEAGAQSTPAKSDHAKDGHAQVCPFASATHAANPPALMALSAPLRVVQFAAPPPLELRPQLTPAGPPLPARGPPRLA